MIFVVVEELIPESQQNGDTDIPTIGAILGFLVMMILDVALGWLTTFQVFKTWKVKESPAFFTFPTLPLSLNPVILKG